MENMELILSKNFEENFSKIQISQKQFVYRHPTGNVTFTSLRNIIRYINTLGRCESPILIKTKAIIDITGLLYLLKPHELIVTAVLDGYGFCRNTTEAGMYFSMSGLPQDISVGDIFADYSFVRYSNGLRIYNPKRIASIFDRI